MALSVIKPSFPKLAQSVVRLTVERVVAGSIPRTGPKLRLRQLRNEGTPFALQATRPSRASEDHAKWRSSFYLKTKK